jgi:hypothetical protein
MMGLEFPVRNPLPRTILVPEQKRRAEACDEHVSTRDAFRGQKTSG